MKLIQKADVAGKRVLCRLDYDVPYADDGVTIKDTNRIEATMPTIRYLLKSGAKHITIMAHRGQPKVYPDPKLTLEPVAHYLASIFAGKKPAQATVRKNAFAGLLDVYDVSPYVSVVENMRYLEGEEKNNEELAKTIGKDFDLFCFDAFATAHRMHVSTYGMSKVLPGYAGLRVQEEIKNLAVLTKRPNHPYIVIIGGAKIKDKLPVIEALAKHADQFLVGGAVANTFLKAHGVNVKNSLIEPEHISTALRLMAELDRGVHDGGYDHAILLPEDFIWDEDKIVDIGDKTIHEFTKHIASAKTIFWNGNLGLTEEAAFAHGSEEIAKAVVANKAAVKIAAGGDTVGFLHKLGLADQMTFVSSGGGAALEYVAGKELQALKVLE